MCKNRNYLVTLKAEWTKVTNAIFRAGLRPHAIALYLYLASVSESTHPSERQLATALVISRKTVVSHLAALVERNIIRRWFVPLRNGRKSSRYAFVPREEWRVNPTEPSEIPVVEIEDGISGEPHKAAVAAQNGAMDGSPAGPSVAPQVDRFSKEKEKKRGGRKNLSLPHAPNPERAAPSKSVQGNGPESTRKRIRSALRLEAPSRSSYQESVASFCRVVFDDALGCGGILHAHALTDDEWDMTVEELSRWTDRPSVFFAPSPGAKWTREDWQFAHRQQLDEFVRDRRAMRARAEAKLVAVKQADTRARDVDEFDAEAAFESAMKTAEIELKK